MRQLSFTARRAHSCDAAPWRKVTQRKQKGDYFTSFSTGEFSSQSKLKVPADSRSKASRQSPVKKPPGSRLRFDSSTESQSKLRISYCIRGNIYRKVRFLRFNSEPEKETHQKLGSKPSISTQNETQHKWFNEGSAQWGLDRNLTQLFNNTTRVSLREDSNPRQGQGLTGPRIIKKDSLKGDSQRDTHLETSEPTSSVKPRLKLKQGPPKKPIRNKEFTGRAYTNTWLKSSTESGLDSKSIKGPEAKPGFPKNDSNTNLKNISGDVYKKAESKPLYDELFPEDMIVSKARQKNAEARLEKLPVFKWEPKIQCVEKNKKQINPSPFAVKDTNSASHTYEHLSVLLLNACSSTLEESDFFRLGHKGEHIETWTIGIVKVIPVRDEFTLRFKGSYLILFSSSATAHAYHKQITKLHRLSRYEGKYGPFLRPLRPGILQEGESIDDLLQKFSLVPGYGRLSLQILDRPYGPQVNQILRGGGIISSLNHKTKTEHLVLFSLDLGNISITDLRNFIDSNGKRRNLHWNLAGGHDGILELKQNEVLDDIELTEGRQDGRSRRKPSIFIIPFLNEYEARRFVRECHRRPFLIQKDSKDTNCSIINTEMLW